MYEYFAFISYSSVDEKLATKIHKLLESVNLPSDMAKIVPNGLEGRRKFGPVFRDKDELPSSSSLPEALRKYLAKSAYLIVLCSPDAAKSKWVNEEIEYFKLSQGAGKIFCIILNGKPEFWSEQNPQGAFPPSLKDDRSRSVPLAANISDGTAKLDRETLRLVAGMLGVSFDMLYRRERRRQRRIIVGAVGLSMLVLCPLVFFLVRAELATKAAINSASASAKIAREKADQAAINDSIALSQQSDLAYAAGDYRAAAAIALEGMPDRARQIDRPLEPKAQAALSRAIWKLASVERFQQSEDCFHPLLVRKVSKGLWCVTSNDDNKLTIHRPGAIDETFLTDGLPVAQASNLDGSVFAVGTASGILQLHTAFGKVISFTAHGGTGEEMHAPTISSSSASTSVAKSRNSSINQVVISPNSEVIATLGQDGFVKLWSLEGKELFSRKFDGGPRSVTFYPDSTKFVVGSFEGFSTWSLNGRQESNQRFIRQTVGAVAISPDKSWLAYELTDNKLYIESRSGGGGQWTVPISALGLRGHLEFSEDSQRLLHVGGRDLMVLSLATRSVLSRYRSDDITVDGQFLDPHGNEVLLNSPTSIWHVNSLLFEAIDFHPSSFGWTDIELQPNGPLVAATEDQRVAFFNMQGEKLEANLSHEARVWAVKFSPDGKKMLTTSSDKTAKLWDVEQIVPTPKKRQSMNEILTDIATGAYESSYKPLPSKVLRGHSSIVWDGTFSPDGQSILTTSMDGTSRLWDLDGHLLSDLRAPDYPIGQLQKYDPFTNADEPRKWHHGYFSRSGNLILTVTGDNAARLWDKNGILKSTLNVGTARVWDAAFSPDEQEITTVSSDGHVVFWSQDGKKISEFDAKLSEVSAIDFVGESKDLAIKNSSTYIWSHDGKLTTRVIGSNGQISPDGTTMVTLRGEKIEGHDMEGNLLFSIDSFARDIHFLGESQIFVTSSGLVTLQKPPLGENLVSLAKKLLTSCLNEYERQAWQLKPITDISTNPRYCQ